jgi:hypothetical protein
VHGWFYGLQNGLLGDLGFTVTSLDELEDKYTLAIAAVQARYAPSP